MKTLDIILHDEIQNIFDNFAASFGITILFYSLDGKILRRKRGRVNSKFCELIQDRVFDKNKCFSMDESKCRECAEQKKVMNYLCHAGIEEAVAPIFVEAQLVGYAMIGQFRSNKNLPAKVLKTAQEKGCKKELLEYFEELPYYNKIKIKNILALFSMLVDYIITKEIISVKGERLINKTLAYIEQHIDRPISLDEVAKNVGRSRSSISHSFKKILGKSFSKVLIEAKLNKAEEYFKKAPNLSIGEVAFKLGYKDPLYFSRLYKKNKGISPSEHRNNCKK
jgi:YesN/AraC family two-component response regulator